jgi:acetolactate synthase I/II/III large subunit
VTLHHRLAAETNAAYPIAVSPEADIGRALEALTSALASDPRPARPLEATIRALRDVELTAGEADSAFPLKPQRIVADIRNAMGNDRGRKAWISP